MVLCEHRVGIANGDNVVLIQMGSYWDLSTMSIAGRIIPSTCSMFAIHTFNSASCANMAAGGDPSFLGAVTP